MRWTVWGLLALVLGCSGVRTPQDSHAQPRRVAIPGGRGVFDLQVLPGDAGVVADTTGPNPLLVVLDSNLAWSAQAACHYERIRVAPEGGYLCGFRAAGHDVDVLSLPDLKPVRRLMAGAWGLDGVRGLVPLDKMQVWAMVWRSSRLSKLLVGPDGPREVGRRFGEKGSYVMGSDQDPESGYIVVIRAKNELCLYDPESLGLVFRTELGVEQVDFAVAAANGIAWVGTKDGRLLTYDLVERRSIGTTSLLTGGRVRIALSPSRKHLAAVSYRGTASKGIVCVLKLYEIDAHGLSEVFSGRYVLDAPPDAVAILERTNTVLIGGSHGLLQVRY